MIDGLLTHVLVKDLKEKIVSGRIQKIYQINDFELLFKIRANGVSYQLINSIQSNAFRLHLSKNNYKTPENATNFTMLLRKQLEGGIITDIKQQDNDRSIILEVKKLNEMRDEQIKYLIFELTGRHSNTILCDSDYKIIQTLKFIPLSMGLTRIMQKGVTYTPLLSDKLNPIVKIENTDNYMDKYQGFSAQLNKEFIYRNQQGQDAKSILVEYLNSKTVYVYQDTISMIPLTYLDSTYQVFDNLDEAFDYQYRKESDDKTVKQIYKQEIKNIKSTIKRNERKISKLENDYQTNQGQDDLKEKAKLIYDNLYLFNKNDHLEQITIFDYDINQDVTINLDSSIDLISNAAKMLTKYNKAKNSLTYIEEEIAKAKHENEVLNDALDNLDYANVNDASEIIEELVRKKYLHLKNFKINKKKKKAPMYETFITPDDTTIYVGKNNIQNDYITFTLASRFDTWLHIKGLPGSHVILHSDNPSDQDLEWAARLALYYSKALKGLKYEVDYTLVKNLKKLKGGKLGQVTFNTNESLYIDNDYNKIYELKRGH